MPKKIVSFLLSGLVSMMSPWVCAQKQSDTMKALPIYPDESKIIVVTAQQPTFTLKLKSNPTTGYTWFLREYDTQFLMPISHTFVNPEKKLMGAPGFEEWTFKVKSSAFIVPQHFSIRMMYARPFGHLDNPTVIVFQVVTQP